MQNIIRVTFSSEIEGAKKLASEIIKKKYCIILCEEQSHIILETVFSKKKINFFSTFSENENLKKINFELKKNEVECLLSKNKNEIKIDKIDENRSETCKYVSENLKKIPNLKSRCIDIESLVKEVAEDLNEKEDNHTKKIIAVICGINELKCFKANSIFIFNTKKTFDISQLAKHYKMIIEFLFKDNSFIPQKTKINQKSILRKKFSSIEIAEINKMGKEWFYTKKAIPEKHISFSQKKNKINLYDKLILNKFINLFFNHNFDKEKINLKEIENINLRKKILQEIENFFIQEKNYSNIENICLFDIGCNQICIEFSNNILRANNIKNSKQIIILSNNYEEEAILQLHLAYKATEGQITDQEIDKEMILILFKDLKISKKTVYFCEAKYESIIKKTKKIISSF